MTFGLQVRDSSGREIIGPGTFTVRLVDRFTVVAGQFTYARPRAKPGMFCAFQSLSSDSNWVTPRGVVGDGIVTVSSLLGDIGFTTPVECLVMGYV